MHKSLLKVFLNSCSTNRKSKTCTELSRSIENLKCGGLVAIGVTLTMCGTVAQAQPTGKIFRIGFLDDSTASSITVRLETFRQELSKLGWIEGKNVTIEYRFAEGKLERLPELTSDLVRLKVDLIMAQGTPGTLAAKNVTTTIPIVMINAGDPVGAGLVASLARPGGNVTGFSSLASELITKRLEVLKDAVPRLSRVGVLRTPGSNTDLQLKELRAAATALKLNLEEIDTQRDAKGLERPFKSQSRSGWAQ